MNETKCFLYGMGMGLAAGLLLAPRSGVKTRQMLLKAANDGQDRVSDLADAVAAQVQQTKKAARATAHGVASAFEDGKKQLVG
jgi:gas vesicle protein